MATTPISSAVCPYCKERVWVAFTWRQGREGRECESHLSAGNCGHCVVGVKDNGEPTVRFKERSQQCSSK